MSTLSQWAENDEEDDNIVWDESTDQKLAENIGGFHLRKQSKETVPKTIPICKTPTSTGPRLITMPLTPSSTSLGAPPVPISLNTTQVKKKDTRKTTKFGLGGPCIPSPVNQKLQIEFRSNGGVNTKRRGTKTKPAAVADIGVASTSSGGSMNSTAVRNSENPEQLRRFLLAEVKQMSIERLVADAKRYMYLEEFHEKHTNPAYAPSDSSIVTSST